MNKTRVLVVEDSLTVRKRLGEVLAADGGFEVVGEAADGHKAIELCLGLRPDVITMDMVLPGMNGLAATEYIMAHCPTPILIVSASFNRGEMFTTFEALSAGAVDVFEKPQGTEQQHVWERGFVTALRIVSRVRAITHPRARLREQLPQRELPPAPVGRMPTPPRGIELVAIGASTGGPAALVELLSQLPGKFPLPILIVLHIAAPFAATFVEWLRSQIARDVEYATQGERLDGLAGRIRLAPADRHLIVRNRRLHLTDDPPRHSCRPSVDELFESVAREFKDRSAAALLTGMGRDGASGLLALHQNGAYTLAQDEQSCVVYGMPREAVLLGAAKRVLNPIAIARELGVITAAEAP